MGKLPPINRRPFTSPNAGRSTPRSAEREEAAGGGTESRARSLRKSATDAERILWAALRPLRNQGLHFRRQAPIGRYIVDFACHRSKIVVELDGSQHGEDANLRHDAERTMFLNSRGYRVLRFWNLDVFRNRDGVAEAIVRAAQIPPPARPRQCEDERPPHQGEVKG